MCRLHSGKKVHLGGGGKRFASGTWCSVIKRDFVIQGVLAPMRLDAPDAHFVSADKV